MDAKTSILNQVDTWLDQLTASSGLLRYSAAGKSAIEHALYAEVESFKPDDTTDGLLDQAITAVLHSLIDCLITRWRAKTYPRHEGFFTEDRRNLQENLSVALKEENASFISSCLNSIWEVFDSKIVSTKLETPGSSDNESTDSPASSHTTKKMKTHREMQTRVKKNIYTGYTFAPQMETDTASAASDSDSEPNLTSVFEQKEVGTYLLV